METTERIVETYVRYVKGLFTLPNIRCDQQYEIDLLAIDPNNHNRYHIESGVSISGAYSKLTDKPYSDADLKTRVKQAGQRRTLDYFANRKFGNPCVLRTLKKYGFNFGEYKKVIVTWGWMDGVPERAKQLGIELWDFGKIMCEIADKVHDGRTYFTDDTLRTLHLLGRARADRPSNVPGKHTKIFGHSVTSVIRWMGANEWDFPEARRVLKAKQIDVADSTVRIQLQAGRVGDKSRGEPASLTASQASELTKLLKNIL
jgi:hypothetical protein